MRTVAEKNIICDVDAGWMTRVAILSAFIVVLSVAIACVPFSPAPYVLLALVVFALAGAVIQKLAKTHQGC